MRRCGRLGSAIADPQGIRMTDAKPGTKQKPRTARQARVVAYHEAGHAVVAHYLRIRVHRVSIAENEYSAGRATVSTGEARRVEFDDSDRVRIKVEHQVCVLLAGFLAARRAVPRSEIGKGSEDRKEAYDWLHRIASSDEVPHYFKLLSLRTGRLLDKLWFQVEVVAKVLLERTHLSKQEVLAVMDESWMMRFNTIQPEELLKYVKISSEVVSS